MGSKWIEVSLGEISEKIGDGIHGTPVYNDSGNYYFINGSNLSDNSIKITDTTKRVDHDEFLKHRKELSDNTVLVSINGTIGNTALYNNEDIILGKSACYINLKDCISKYFILYILSGYLFQEYIQRCSTGSTIKNVSLKMMRDFRFLMPESKEDQEKAVHIIQKVDERKRLNNAQNKTLEQMSQTLFKSWFVDFDPVIDNALDAGNPIPETLQSRAELRQKVRNSIDFKPLPADIRALFPAEFEETELGWVPKTWNIEALDNIANFQNGLALQKFRPENNEEKYLPVLKIADLRAGYINNDERVTFDIVDSCKVYDGDMIFSWSGTLMIDIWTGGNAALNQHLYKVTSQKYPQSFYLMWTKQHLSRFQHIAEAKAVTMGHIKKGDLSNSLCLVPSSLLVNKYDNIVGKYFAKIKNQRLLNNQLTALRDTLLPKLISGELSLEDLPDLVGQTEAA
ncbi:TPA: restriction endonuclease subunit S [Citrobacter freundii]|uniref:restriction endonuclease subunit S n=1 Tax=Citrobacter freundii TaxID=546 RepID=UPI00333BDE46|nr:restriction endonuclease subunit S [Citrobacter freundii]